MQPNWNDIRVFLAYIRNGSIKAASAELKISGPTISRRIETLQQCIGQPLFRRKPEGIELVPATRRLVSIWEEAETLLQFALHNTLGRDAGHWGVTRAAWSSCN